MGRPNSTIFRRTAEVNCENCTWAMGFTVETGMVWREATTHTLRMGHTVHVNYHQEKIIHPPNAEGAV